MFPLAFANNLHDRIKPMHILIIIIFMDQTCQGSAVAVERIFSGGRDTISLRRASLHADMIHTLMRVKKQLHRVCIFDS